MLNVEETSKKLSNFLAKELSLGEDKEAIINYGLFAIIQTIISIIFVLTFGFIFNVAFEAFIISLTMSVLRKSSGGIHATTPVRCVLVATIFSVGMSIAIKNVSTLAISFDFISKLIIFIWAYIVIYKLAPVDSPSKPIKSIAKKRKLKKNSIYILTVFLIITGMNNLAFIASREEKFIVYNYCIYISIVWQVFSLTKIGHIILYKLDDCFKYINL